MTDIIIIRADELIEHVRQRPVAAVLSIEHPGVTPESPGYAPRLSDHAIQTPQKILSFWDLPVTIAGTDERQQIEDGLRFALDHLKKGDVIIHCRAGKSRSTAVALGVMALYHPQMSEKDLVEKLMSIRDVAAPNPMVLAMVDEIAGRGGRLIQAVNEHPKAAFNRAVIDKNQRELIAKDPEKFKKVFPELFRPGNPGAGL